MSERVTSAVSAMGAWDDLMNTVFSEHDRQKFEWAIGSIFAGGRKNIVVLYGPPASGKSTVMHIVERMLNNLVTDSPVVFAHDGIRYFEGGLKSNAAVFVASHIPIRVHALDGSPRLIEVHTTGNTIPYENYNQLVDRTYTETNIIARHCLEVYRELGGMYYDINQENNQ